MLVVPPRFVPSAAVFNDYSSELEPRTAAFAVLLAFPLIPIIKYNLIVL